MDEVAPNLESLWCDLKDDNSGDREGESNKVKCYWSWEKALKTRGSGACLHDDVANTPTNADTSPAYDEYDI